jgi:hypothetical protein
MFRAAPSHACVLAPHARPPLDDVQERRDALVVARGDHVFQRCSEAGQHDVANDLVVVADVLVEQRL